MIARLPERLFRWCILRSTIPSRNKSHRNKVVIQILRAENSDFMAFLVSTR
jgi:hypothetical protein